VNAVLPAADRPQLVVALPESALNWASGGYVVDLNDYVADPEYGLSQEQISDFPVPFWSQDVAAGKRLAIPAERGAGFLVYDAKWARELGFDAPPRTAAEFREQACRAHQSLAADPNSSNDSQGGWLVRSDAVTFLSWIGAFAGGVVDGDGYRFLTPTNLSALTFVKQLYDDGCAWIGSPSQDVPAAFASRTALFASAGLEQLSDFSRAIAAAGSGDAWTVLAYPGPDQSGLVIYGASYVMLRSTPEQQLASWLLLRWLLLPQNQEKWAEVTGFFPLRNSSLGLLGDYRKSHPQWSSAVELLPLAQIQPDLASWRQVRVMVGDGFDAMFRSDTPSGRVAEILAGMDKIAADLAK
jgi:multiple sugar transport system substrate-binding protein